MLQFAPLEPQAQLEVAHHSANKLLKRQSVYLHDVTGAVSHCPQTQAALRDKNEVVKPQILSPLLHKIVIRIFPKLGRLSFLTTLLILAFLWRCNQLFKPLIYPLNRVYHVHLLNHHKWLCVGFRLPVILPNPLLLCSFVHFVVLVVQSVIPFFRFAQEGQIFEVHAGIVDEGKMVDNKFPPCRQHPNDRIISLPWTVMRIDVHDSVFF